MTTMHRGWDQQRVDGLTATEAAKLRADLSKQSMAQDPSERRDAFALLRLLANRSDGARSVEDRASDAKAFLYGKGDAAAAERAWQTALELRGGDEKQARRAGYRPPGEAA